MRIEDVLKLKEAGFSAEEISQLAPSIKEEEPAPVQAAPEIKQPEVVDHSEEITALKSQIEQLQTDIRKALIRQTSIPEQATDTMADIAATILNGGKK